jgi:hypothetical protein
MLSIPRSVDEKRLTMDLIVLVRPIPLIDILPACRTNRGGKGPQEVRALACQVGEWDSHFETGVGHTPADDRATGGAHMGTAAVSLKSSARMSTTKGSNCVPAATCRIR